MNDLFGRSWEKPGYADLARAEVRGEELWVDFVNGDHVVVPIRQFGLREPSGANIDEEGLAVRVETHDGPVDLLWHQIRAATDPAFAQELRRRDNEEARRIGLRLKALREDKGISQRHLAEQVAMPPAQLAKIESGNFDLRLSTVTTLLRAMGASLADITGPNVPEVSTRDIARHARGAGVPQDLINVILRALRRNEVTSGLSHAFGWLPSVLVAGQPELKPFQMAVQFKTGDADAAAASPLLPMAYRISEWIAQTTDSPSPVAIPTEVDELRSAAEVEGRQMTLGVLSKWAWKAGVVVVPIRGSGAFAAASWRVNGRPVIILKDSRPFAPFWLFDLAHELGHIALGHASESAVVDVDSPTPERSSDTQEEQANRFALELVLPRYEELLTAVRQDARGDYMRFKFSVQRIAQRARVSEGMLAMVAAYALTEIGQYKDRWGSASNLARPEGQGRAIVQNALRMHLNIDRLPRLEREIVDAVCLSE